MNKKTKNIINCLLFALIIPLIIVLLLAKPNKTISVAHADTTNAKYIVAFDYENTYQVDFANGNKYNDKLREGKDVTTASMIYASGKTTNVSIGIYSSSILEDEILNSSEFIDSNTITIKVVSDFFSYKIELIKEDGSHYEVYSDNLKELKLGNGLYSACIFLEGEVIITDYATYNYSATCNFSFTILSSDPCAEGHLYQKIETIAPTCINDGYSIYSCSRCQDSYISDTTLALGHKYLPSKVNSTCTDEGYTLFTCSRCGSNYRSGTTEAMGHDYKEIIFEATCTDNGYTMHECTRCGDKYYDNKTLPLGHKYQITSMSPTCTDYGKIVSTCQVCGYIEERIDGTFPTGHSYTNEIIRSATCTEDGLRRTICDVCGETTEMVIKAHGHNYEITDTAIKDGFTVRTYTCSECGVSYTQELGNQYEEVSNYVEYLFEQYSPYMIWVFLATAGLWSIAIGVAIIIAHKNDEKEKAKKMLINYVVGLVIIFAILVACPYLVRGIAVLVT